MAGKNDKWIKSGHLTAERYATMVEWMLEQGLFGELNLTEPDPAKVSANALEALVKAFQTLAKISADGVFGPGTTRKLAKLTGAADKGKPLPVQTAPSALAGKAKTVRLVATATVAPVKQLAPRDTQRLLAKLGYYDGAINGDLASDKFRDDVRTFQKDHKLTADGIYGPTTERVLTRLADTLDRYAPKGMRELRRWHLTYYYLAKEAEYSGKKSIPMRTPKGALIADVAPKFFAACALEGSGTLDDGRLVNVAYKPSYVDVDPQQFKPVFQFAKKNRWIPNKAGYAGLRTDGKQATQARSFRIVQKPGKGWGVLRGIPLEPFRTLAADIGVARIKRHDRAYVGKGGVVPPKTRVFILEFAGRTLPDGTVHDGWFTVNDTGGGIFGAHFDVFTGSRKAGKAARIPPRAHIWFEGIEDRIPIDYTYGL